MAGRPLTITRRRALQLGAAAGATAALGGPVTVARASSSAPKYLRRATYGPLTGQGFQIGGRMLSLESVADLAGAAGDAELRGHDEAFALTFTGAAGLAAATHKVVHPAFGTASLLVTPVDRSDGASQRYEIVIDRSVGRPADPPEPAPGRSAPDPHPGTPEAAAAAVAQAERKLVRKAAARRKALIRRRRRQRVTGRALIKKRRKTVRRKAVRRTRRR